ncbi:hypothetical protein Plhal703r1_c05g0026621 [Plasmopara halstedii]
MEVATSNYFNVLSIVEVNFYSARSLFVSRTDHAFRSPCKVKASTRISVSKEASHFLTKRHISFMKTEKPASVQKIVAEIRTTEDATELQLPPDRLAGVDSRVSWSCKVLRNTINENSVIYYASCLVFNTVQLQEMTTANLRISDLAYLHLSHCVLSTTDRKMSTTFANAWAKHIGG